MSKDKQRRGDGDRVHPLREPMVWLVVLIPLSAVLMGIVTIALSIASFDGLVADDYYRRGLEINRTLARDDAAADLALSARLELDPARGTITLELTGNERFVPPPSIDLQLFHATRSGFDRHVELRTNGASRHYRGDGLALAPGHWHVQLEAEDWRLTGSLDAPRKRRVLHIAARSR